MRRPISLLLMLLVVFASFAQRSFDRENLNKTFIKDRYYLPDGSTQAALRNMDNWQNFIANHGSWWVEFNEVNNMPHRASGVPITIENGTDPVEKGWSVITELLADFNIPLDEIVFLHHMQNEKHHYLDFKQQYSGLDVVFSNIKIRLNQEEELVLFGLDIYNDIDISIIPSLSPSAIGSYAITDIPYNITNVAVNPDLMILPIPEEGSYQYRLVYEVTVDAEEEGAIPMKFIGLVDANNGEVLYRQNIIHDCSVLDADVTVEATITDNPLRPTEVRGLPYLRVEVDGINYYTDENGILNLPSVISPVSGTVYLDGLYAETHKAFGSAPTSSFPVNLMPGANLLSFDGFADDTEISAYYHTNRIHDYVKSFFPTFDLLDFPLPVIVDITSDACNAFYDGSSINFYAAGGGCPDIALLDDVVYHEYGHGINDFLYQWQSAFFFNGALGEGYADVWALGRTELAILGQGFSGGSGTFVRRYDIDPKVYPDDLSGAVHGDGEIIAGAWWDLGQIWGSVSDMMDLFALTQYATPMAPSGSEGILYRDILLEALLADDTDGDLSNGTPNDEDIIEAFRMHGITLLANAVVVHNPEDYLDATASIEISADLDVDFPAYLGELAMYYRTNPSDPYTQVAMVESSGGTGDTYTANIPAQPEGTVIEYYFEVFDSYGGSAVVTPKKANAVNANLPYFSLVGYGIREKEDFDNFFGDWEININGDDNATTGIWEFNSPIQTISGSTIVQPGFDNTAEGANLNLCAFTGNAASSDGLGANDVDGGKTSLRSPIYDLSSFEEPLFTYYRWYINDPPTGANPANDYWDVWISNDGNTYIPVERTNVSDNSWRRNVVKVSDYVVPTSTVSLMFIASDSIIPGEELDGGSLVEAAVDDLYVWDLGEENSGTFIEEVPGTNLDFNIYPNPTSGAFSILLEADFLEDVNLEISNALGQLIYSKGYSLLTNKEIVISDLGLSSGTYFIKLRFDDKLISKRILINKL